MRTEAVSNEMNNTGAPPRALRLVFKYEGSDVELISKKLITKVAPPTDNRNVDAEESGFWFVILDNKRNVLYRRIIENPIQYAAEVRTDDPHMPLKWEEQDKPKGHFSVIIPELPKASRIELFSSPLKLRKRFEPAKQLAGFRLKKVSRKKEDK